MREERRRINMYVLLVPTCQIRASSESSREDARRESSGGMKTTGYELFTSTSGLLRPPCLVVPVNYYHGACPVILTTRFPSPTNFDGGSRGPHQTLKTGPPVSILRSGRKEEPSTRLRLCLRLRHGTAGPDPDPGPGQATLRSSTRFGRLHMHCCWPWLETAVFPVRHQTYY